MNEWRSFMIATLKKLGYILIYSNPGFLNTFDKTLGYHDKISLDHELIHGIFVLERKDLERSIHLLSSFTVNY